MDNIQQTHTTKRKTTHKTKHPNLINNKKDETHTNMHIPSPKKPQETIPNKLKTVKEHNPLTTNETNK